MISFVYLFIMWAIAGGFVGYWVYQWGGLGWLVAFVLLWIISLGLSYHD